MRYKNNGKYNKRLIENLFNEWCELTSRDKSKYNHFSTEFLDEVWEMAAEMATGGSVKRFLRECREIREDNNGYRIWQSLCLLNTYTEILEAVIKAEKYGRYYG